MDYNVLKELATKIKDEIKLEDYFKKLANNGVLTYDQTIGNEMYYKKEGQHTGSISVNTDKNIWYDHSEDKGGDIFSAVERFEGVDGYYKQVKHLSNNSFEFKHISKDDTIKQKQKVKEKYDFQLKKNDPNVNHPSLLNYLYSRGLNVADTRGVITEVHWENKGKKYFALGLPQPNGKGFSLFNKGGYKMNVGKIRPVMFTVGENPKGYKTFEASLDFVSYKKLNLNESYHAVVLNSTSQAMQVSRLDLRDTTNELYLDNDKAGREATNLILDLAVGNSVKNTKDTKEYSILDIDVEKGTVSIELKQSAEKQTMDLSRLKRDYRDGNLEIERKSNNIDKSDLYKGYEDVNDYLVNGHEKKNEVDTELSR